MTRLYLLALLLPLAIDCAANWFCGGSLRNTLSGEAWHAREHKYWRWTHRAIDALFFWQDGHCQAQAERETKHGSVWRAWAHSWRN